MNVLIGVNVTSPFQLVCFISYLKNNLNKFDKIILYTYNYWGKGQIYDSYMDALSFFNVDVRSISSNGELIGSVINELKSNSDVTFFCVNSPYFPFKFFKPTCKFVVISDGLGTYSGLLKSIIISAKEKSINLFSYKFILLILKRFAVSFFSIVIKYESYMLYSPYSLKKSNEFSSSLRDTLKSFKSNRTGLPGPSLIFLSQPLVQLGLLSEVDYMGCLNRAREFANKEGLDFFIKLHPTEIKIFNSLDYKDIKPYHYDGLIEEACVNDDNIKVVVSFFSSGLYMIPELSAAKVYSVSSDDLLKSLKFSRNQKIIFSTIKKLP